MKERDLETTKAETLNVAGKSVLPVRILVCPSHDGLDVLVCDLPGPLHHRCELC